MIRNVITKNNYILSFGCYLLGEIVWSVVIVVAFP